MGTRDLQEIRRQLREKFPQAHAGVPAQEPPPPPAERPLDLATFPAGTISEVLPAAETGGLSLWLAGLLGEPDAHATLPHLILLDAGDAFDPASHTPAACSQLLWVRYRKIPEILKAADILVRDGNIPSILLDVQGLPAADLRAIPHAAWWRLKQLCERVKCRLIVLASAPLVPCASLRLTLSARSTLHDFDLPRPDLLPRLTTRTQKHIVPASTGSDHQAAS